MGEGSGFTKKQRLELGMAEDGAPGVQMSKEERDLLDGKDLCERGFREDVEGRFRGPGGFTVLGKKKPTVVKGGVNNLKKGIYRVGSPMPSEAAFASFGGVDGKVLVMPTGEVASDVQVISFKAKYVSRLRNGRGYRYAGVDLEVGQVLFDNHNAILPAEASSWKGYNDDTCIDLPEDFGITLELNNEYGRRLLLEFSKFKGVSCKFGIGIDDVLVDIWYTLHGGVGKMTGKNLPRNKDGSK